MKISVVISTYNRPELLLQTIATLQKNTISELETIVVNDASDNPDVDKYLEKVSKIIYHKFDKRVSIGEVKNKGISLMGKSDFIHFCDDDIYYTYGWDIKLMDALMNFPDIGVIGGKAHPHHTVLETRKFLDYEIQIMNSQHGYSLFIRSEDLDKFTPFRSFPLEITGGEDSGFCEKVLENNLKIAAVNPPVIYHCGLKTFKGTKPADYNDIMIMKHKRPDILFL